MSYIKAYSDENRKHSDLYVLQCLDNKVEFVLAKLADHFDVKQLKVTWKGRGGAYYRPWGHTINFTPGKTTWLTVCHEFAHALTNKERKAKMAAIQKVIDRATQKRGEATCGGPVWCAAGEQIRALRAKRDKIDGLKAHSADFDENVDRVCAYVREQKLQEGAEVLASVTPIPQIVVMPDVHIADMAKGGALVPPEFDLVQRYFDRLPDELFCGKCCKRKPKAEVGVRVMSRSYDGRPTKVSRQSYCKVCRSGKK